MDRTHRSQSFLFLIYCFFPKVFSFLSTGEEDGAENVLVTIFKQKCNEHIWRAIWRNQKNPSIHFCTSFLKNDFIYLCIWESVHEYEQSSGVRQRRKRTSCWTGNLSPGPWGHNPSGRQTPNQLNHLDPRLCTSLCADTLVFSSADSSSNVSKILLPFPPPTLKCSLSLLSSFFKEAFTYPGQNNFPFTLLTPYFKKNFFKFLFVFLFRATRTWECGDLFGVCLPSGV